MSNEHFDIETLSAFADGELTGLKAMRLERHLGVCHACRHTLERLRAIVATAGALPREVAPPPESWAAVRSQIPSSKTDSGTQVNLDWRVTMGGPLGPPSIFESLTEQSQSAYRGRRTWRGHASLPRVNVER